MKTPLEPSAHSFPFEKITVKAWIDPTIQRHGYELRSEYVEKFWLPILGPTTLLLLRKISYQFENKKMFTLQTEQWASEIGVGRKKGKHSPFWRSILRAEKFKLAQVNRDKLYVREKLPPLTQRQAERLPLTLIEEHTLYR